MALLCAPVFVCSVIFIHSSFLISFLSAQNGITTSTPYSNVTSSVLGMDNSTTFALEMVKSTTSAFDKDNSTVPESPTVCPDVSHPSYCTWGGILFPQVANFLSDQTSHMTCTNPDLAREVSHAMHCSVMDTFIQSCGAASMESNSVHLLPGQEQMKTTIELLCRWNATINRECVLDRSGHIEKCLGNDMKALKKLQGKSQPQDSVLLCRYVEMEVLCVWELLEDCGEETSGLLTGLVAIHLKPDICPSFAGANKRSWDVWVIFLLQLVVFPITMSC